MDGQSTARQIDWTEKKTIATIDRLRRELHQLRVQYPATWSLRLGAQAENPAVAAIIPSLAQARHREYPCPPFPSAYRCINLNIVRTTVTLDDDVYEAAMHFSRASGERLGKVLSILARRGLKPADSPAPRSARRFPVFDVPANAPVIPASRIQRVIDEEGLF